MDFCYKLFPYKSLFIADGNTLTIYWVLFTITVFLIGSYFLVRIINIIKANITLSLNNFPTMDVITDMNLKSLWDEYKETFIEHNGSFKTDAFASEYFNEINLISHKTNLKLLNSIPNMLVGFGILGTFIGLTFGISSFNTTSSDAIKSSIEVLLSGMGTAFVSSIYGMVFSIIFTLLEKAQTHKLQILLDKYCYKIDKLYKITKDDERNIQLKQQEKALIEIFYLKDEEGHLVKPANIFRDIYEESRIQSRALQSFSTDLATTIDAGFQSLILNNQKGIIPELQNLKIEIEKLGDKLKDPATEMTQSVVKDLENAMKDMISGFKSTVSDTTKSELENLTTLLNNAGSHLIDFPNKLQLMTDNLNSNFIHLQEVVSNISQQTLIQSQNSTDNMRLQMEELSEILKNKVGDLQTGQEAVLNKQKQNLQITETLLSELNNSIEQMAGLSNGITDSVTGFKDVQAEMFRVSRELVSISGNMSHTSEILRSAQSNFERHAQSFLDSNELTLNEIQSMLSNASIVSNDFSEKFSIIDKGLVGIFNQIQTGLIEYKDAVGTSLETYLGKYSESLTKTAESLAGAVESQIEFLEDLTDLVSKKNFKA